MSIRKIPVACVQLAAHDRADFEKRLPHILTLITSSARTGAKLIVLPEGTVPGYVLGHEEVDTAQLARAERELQTLAREHATTIVYGTAYRDGARTMNCASVIGPDGTVLGRAAKRFLWHFDRHWFARGETLEPIETPLGRLGLLVCADGRIPTLAATLVERGAEMLVMSTAWVTSGRDPHALENVQADLLGAVRARENAVPFVAANKCGVEAASVLYCGKSQIVDAHGAIVERASEDREEIVAGEVEIGALPQRRAFAGFTREHEGEVLNQSRERARIAITPACEPAHVAQLAKDGAEADADLLIACGEPAAPRDDIALLSIADASMCDDDIIEVAGIRIGIAGDATFESPRGLVGARLDGVGAFVWNASGSGDWQTRIARARALELRAYVIVLAREEGRAFACDPDGVVVCGTFGAFRMAAFGYDAARTRATLVAPGTDVLEGLRYAETLRPESTHV